MVQLQNHGIQPEMITDVIITHSHFDHIGTAHRYPNANIWIQRAEYKSFRKSSRYKRVSAAYLKAEKEGRLKLVDGNTEIMSGVHVMLTGGHTIGHQVIRIDHTESHIFVGDECYKQSLCQNQIILPNASCYNKAKNKAFLQKLGVLYTQGVHVHRLHEF